MKVQKGDEAGIFVMTSNQDGGAKSWSKSRPFGKKGSRRALLRLDLPQSLTQHTTKISRWILATKIVTPPESREFENGLLEQ